ncbi:MAG: hypothetical protein ACE5FY_01695 [Nitrospiria bacterium]
MNNQNPFLNAHISFFPTLLVLCTFWGCSINNVEKTVKNERSQRLSEIENEEKSTKKQDFRAWIHAISLSPGSVYSGDQLTATTNWGPEGRSDVWIQYQWFINGELIHQEKSSQFLLDQVQPGDRIYAEAHLIRPDGSVAASLRSHSNVVQNRPPKIDSGMETLVKKDGVFIGQIHTSDPDGDTVTLTQISGPEGLVISPDGAVRWPEAKVSPGDHQISLELQDERGLGFRGELLFSMQRQTQ